MSTISTKMKTITALYLLAVLLLLCSLSIATRPDPVKQPSKVESTSSNQNNKPGETVNNAVTAAGVPGVPGSGFDIPGFGQGWGNGIIGGGYGGGYGGPKGGYSRGGVIRPTAVCKEKGPCYMKKLTCPAKCFTSYSRSGKGYGGGGGGGGCTMDCKSKCIAYC